MKFTIWVFWHLQFIRLTTNNYLVYLVAGPGCSSLAYGAMQELGPFRVHSDGKTLYKNPFAWNHGMQGPSSCPLSSPPVRSICGLPKLDRTGESGRLYAAR